VFRFSLQLVTQTFLIIRRIQRVVIIVYMFLSKVGLRIFIVKFVDFFLKILKYQTTSRSFYCETRCSKHPDGTTNMMRLIIDFSNFANVPDKTKAGQQD